MKIGVYPGSFDPITNGHLDIIERSARLFDKVIVAVSLNARKTPLFEMEERVELLEQVLKPYSNVEIDYFKGLTADYVENRGAQAIIRGLRATSDFENEFQMAVTNKKMKPKIETLFLMSKPNFSYLSSSLVKEIASLNGCVKGFVPDYVEQRLKEKYL